MGVQLSSEQEGRKDKQNERKGKRKRDEGELYTHR